MAIAVFLVNAFYGYLTIGAVFSIWFILKGAATLDKGMEGTTWKLRLLLLPGAALLWPVLVIKHLKHKPE